MHARHLGRLRSRRHGQHPRRWPRPRPQLHNSARIATANRCLLRSVKSVLAHDLRQLLHELLLLGLHDLGHDPVLEPLSSIFCLSAALIGAGVGDGGSRCAASARRSSLRAVRRRFSGGSSAARARAASLARGIAVELLKCLTGSPTVWRIVPRVVQAFTYEWGGTREMPCLPRNQPNSSQRGV